MSNINGTSFTDDSVEWIKENPKKSISGVVAAGLGLAVVLGD